MGNLIVQDIVWHIGQNLEMGQIFCLACIDKQINSYVKNITWIHDVVNLQFFDEETLLNVFRTYKFTSVDLSNTMITDSFSADMTFLTNLTMKSCIGITDDFIKKIPKCRYLDLTSCINVTGSFLEYRGVWSTLILSECISFDAFRLLKLQKCNVLDLRSTNMLHGKLKEKFIEKLAFVFKRCNSIIVDEGLDPNPIMFYQIQRNDMIKNLLKDCNATQLPYESDPTVPPSITHICNYFKSETTYTQAKNFMKLYIRRRYNFFMKILSKIDNRDTTSFYIINNSLTPTLDKMTENIKEPNILNNKFFFQIACDTSKNEFFHTKNITYIDSYYYDNDVLNDMIKVNYCPRVDDTSLKYMSRELYGYESTLSNSEPTMYNLLCGKFSNDITPGYKSRGILGEQLYSYLDTCAQIKKDNEERIPTELDKIEFFHTKIRDEPISTKQIRERIKEHFVKSHVEISKNMDSCHCEQTGPMSKKEFNKKLRCLKRQRKEFDTETFDSRRSKNTFPEY